MFFCPNCKNLLLVEQARNYLLICQTCDYTYELTEKERIINYKINRSEPILDKDDEFRYASKCEKLCVCGNNRAAFYEMQTRSADEPMTIFYQCTKCKQVWKE